MVDRVRQHGRWAMADAAEEGNGADHPVRSGTPLDPSGVLNALGSTLYDWDVAGGRIAWGANAAMLFGLKDVTRIESAHVFARMVSARSAGSREDIIAETTETDAGFGVPFSLRYELALPGGLLPVEDSGRWFADADGKPARVKGLLRLLTADGAGSIVSYGDHARADLLRSIEQALASVRSAGRPFALLVASIGGLGALDREHGSELCDRLIAEVASRLNRALRRTDTLVRYSTSKIGILLARCGENEIEHAVNRLTEAVNGSPIALEEGVFPLTLAFGGITDPEGAREARIVLRRCEDAMQRSVKDGALFTLYKPDQKRDMRRLHDQTMADAIVRALNERRIVIAHQPIVSAKTRKTAFCEALVRLQRDDGAFVPAGSIVPVFERMGRVHLLDHRVLELTLGALAADAALRLSVNVSTSTLMGQSWMSTLAAGLIGRADLADRLIVELTESQAIENVAATRRIFAALKAMGVRTAIDDFGAGYTSFKHLRGLDVDILKIDGAFVQNIGRSADDSFFVRTLIDLAQHLGIETVAEWVIDEEAARKLAAWGVTYLQGDFIAPAEVPSVNSRIARMA